MFLRFFRLSILAFEVGERYVQRLVPEPLVVETFDGSDLVRLHDDAELTRRITTNGRETVKARFDGDRLARIDRFLAELTVTTPKFAIFDHIEDIPGTPTHRLLQDRLALLKLRFRHVFDRRRGHARARSRTTAPRRRPERADSLQGLRRSMGSSLRSNERMARQRALRWRR